MRSEGYFKDISDKDVFLFIRGISEDFRISLIVSGSHIGKLLDAISVWNYRFRELRLGSLPREDSIYMLKTLFNLSGFEVPDDVIEYIAMSVCDHPYYMQLFGYHLVELGKIDENTIETVKNIVLHEILNLYKKKYREIKRMGDEYMKILNKMAEGMKRSSCFSLDEWELIWDLERANIVYNYGTHVDFTDELFERFIINTMSGRAEEKILPEYASEYLIARNLAYKQGYKEVLISFKSWGPFDIVVYSNINEYEGFGIQVKTTSKDHVVLTKKKLNEIINVARKRRLIPLLGVIYSRKPLEIKYYLINENKTKYEFKEGRKRINDILQMIINK